MYIYIFLLHGTGIVLVLFYAISYTNILFRIASFVTVSCSTSVDLSYILIYNVQHHTFNRKCCCLNDSFLNNSKTISDKVHINRNLDRVVCNSLGLWNDLYKNA